MQKVPLALVTGAAHRLGRSFALTLARLVYSILVHYNQFVEAAAVTADDIRALGVPVYPNESVTGQTIVVDGGYSLI
jgi:NAD(P)-dependent dehydrogenase (short-subunit alcohol dehydrogenase family)